MNSPLDNLNRDNSFFLIVFIFTLIVVWSPFKKVAYLLPFLSIWLLFILSGDFKVLVKGIAFPLAIILYGSLTILLLNTGILSNVCVFSITSSSFAFYYAINDKYCNQQQFYIKTSNILLGVILVEALLGIIQGGYGAFFAGTFDGGVGDHVEGSIAPALASSRSYSNPLFVTNICFSLLYVWPSIGRSPKKWAIVLLGILSIFLASVMHLLLFILLALVISKVLLEKGRVLNKSILTLLVVVLLAIISIYSITPKNIGNFSHKYELLQKSKSPKARVVQTIATEFPKKNILTPVLGVGPGQFASRASHLSSGYLIGDILDSLGPGSSEFFNQFMVPIIVFVNKNYYHAGSTENPFFSWGMVYSEFGFIGIMLVLLALKKGLSIRRYYNTSDPMIKSCVYVSTTMVIFLFLIGSQDSYWETPQAILLGLMLLHIIRSFITAKH